MRRTPNDSKVSWLSGKRSWKKDPVIKTAPVAYEKKAKVEWIDSVERPATYVDGLHRAAIHILKVFRPVAMAIYRIRGLLLSIPVALAALRLAAENMVKLPATVHYDSATVDAQKNLIFESFAISREVAVYGPLALTFFCLLMMLLSRRIVYPWVISIFTLVLPVVLLFVNSFP